MIYQMMAIYDMIWYNIIYDMIYMIYDMIYMIYDIWHDVIWHDITLHVTWHVTWHGKTWHVTWYVTWHGKTWHVTHVAWHDMGLISMFNRCVLYTSMPLMVCYVLKQVVWMGLLLIEVGIYVLVSYYWTIRKCFTGKLMWRCDIVFTISGCRYPPLIYINTLPLTSEFSVQYSDL